MRFKSITQFGAFVIQIAYTLVLLGLFWALINGGLTFCIGRACK